MSERSKASWIDINDYLVTYHIPRAAGLFDAEYRMVEAKCSNCGEYSDFVKNRFEQRANYCPCCGYNMDEVSE